MSRGVLSWDKQGDHIHLAWSGNVNVGGIHLAAGGRWWFDATYAVRMGDLSGAAPHCGTVDTLDDAKAAIELAWTTWLQVAGLLE